MLKSTCKGVVSSSVSIASLLLAESDVADDDMETVEEEDSIEVDVADICRGRLTLLLRCTLRASHFVGLILAKVSRIC